MGFGSNLGDGAAIFRAVLDQLANHEIRVLRSSSLYGSEPWGGAEGGTYTNAVIEVERIASPRRLWERMRIIEEGLGRVKNHPLEARICDLDLLLWGGEIVRGPDLRVPHSRLPERKFVLVPLSELIPNQMHPEIHCTFAELLRKCADPLRVWVLDRTLTTPPL